MNLIFLGPPGAGKGTQAKRLYAEFKLPQISTGDILRSAIANGTEMGKKAEPIMKAGGLVPDEVVIGIVRERLREPDCAGGCVLDGFPRTTPQADALDRVLAELGRKVDAVVSLEVPEEKLVERLSGRRTCPRDQSIYHVTDNPPLRAGICDKCGGSLVQRPDDTQEAVKKRLDAYTAQTHPLKEYYDRRGLLRRIDGVGTQEGIFAAIRKAIGK